MEKRDIVREMVEDIKLYVEHEDIDLTEIHFDDLLDRLSTSWVTGADSQEYYQNISIESAAEVCYQYREDIKDAIRIFNISEDKIMDNLKHEENVLGCVLSGAGPSIIVISRKNNLAQSDTAFKGKIPDSCQPRRHHHTRELVSPAKRFRTNSHHGINRIVVSHLGGNRQLARIIRRQAVGNTSLVSQLHCPILLAFDVEIDLLSV